MNAQPVPQYAAPRHQLRKPYLLFLGDVELQVLAKTAFGVRDWAPADCTGPWRLPGCPVTLGLPDLDAAAAAAAGAQSLLIGVAPGGGRIPDHWVPYLLQAVEAGLDVVAGMHTRLNSIPVLVEAARKHGVQLIDVRVPPDDLPVGTGLKRSGKRLLTVGSDCALGKKYTALALHAGLVKRGVPADFRATGQTGIMIAGNGIPIDAVVSDFVAGAAEALSPAAAPDHWDIVEGQGSIIHPAYAGVTLGLLHGSQPDALVLCHDPSRTHIAMAQHVKIPELDVLARRYIEAAQLTNPDVRLVGVSLNTSSLDDEAAAAELARVEQQLGVPAFDPIRTSPEAVIDRMLAP